MFQIPLSHLRTKTSVALHSQIVARLWCPQCGKMEDAMCQLHAQPKHPPETFDLAQKIQTDIPESAGLSKSVVDTQGFVKPIVEDGEGDGEGL